MCTSGCSVRVQACHPVNDLKEHSALPPYGKRDYSTALLGGRGLHATDSSDCQNMRPALISLLYGSVSSGHDLSRRREWHENVLGTDSWSWRRRLAPISVMIVPTCVIQCEQVWGRSGRTDSLLLASGISDWSGSHTSILIRKMISSSRARNSSSADSSPSIPQI